MKLICDLCVNNLQYSGVPVGKVRPKKSQLSIIKSAGDHGGLSVVIQSLDNKHGTTYKLSGNVQQFFIKFLSEGKCTLRLVKPSVDLILSNCDKVQLKLFLDTIRTDKIISTDKDGPKADDSKNQNGKRLLERLPTNQKKLKSSHFNERCRTKLTIHNRKELVTTTFSQTLVELRLSGLDLTTISPSIGKLAKLQTLDLSENKLTDLPSTFSGRLGDLNLNGNLLHQSRAKSWNFFNLPNVSKNLRTLNLGNNKLPAVPLPLLGLDELSNLNLAGNGLRKLSSKFGEFKKLTHLDISQNSITALDISFTMLRLAHLNATDAFSPKVPVQEPGLVAFGVPTLKGICSAIIRNYRLNHRILPKTVQEDLLLLRRCKCLKIVPHTEETYKDVSIRDVAQTCVTNGLRSVKFHYSICWTCQNQQRRRAN